MSDGFSEDAPGRGRLSAVRVDPVVAAVGVASSITLHATLVGLVVWGTMRGDEAMEEKTEEEMVKFEDVELLSLGEEKPPQQLPRKANPAPSPDKQETVTLEEKEKPEPEEPEEPPEPSDQEPEEPPEPDDEPDESEAREEAMNEAFESLHNPNRPVNDDTPEGSEKGVAQGTVADEAMASLMGTFKTKFLKKLGENWQIPSTISEEQLQKLYGKVVVYIRLSKDGHVVSYRFLRRSGNEQFDGSIERLLRRFQVTGGGRSLPLPEDSRLREKIIADGIRLTKWEHVTQAR